MELWQFWTLTSLGILALLFLGFLTLKLIAIADGILLVYNHLSRKAETLESMVGRIGTKLCDQGIQTQELILQLRPDEPDEPDDDDDWRR